MQMLVDGGKAFAEMRKRLTLHSWSSLFDNNVALIAMFFK